MEAHQVGFFLLLSLSPLIRLLLHLPRNEECRGGDWRDWQQGLVSSFTGDEAKHRHRHAQMHHNHYHHRYLDQGVCFIVKPTEKKRLCVSVEQGKLK
jgi:hypothetical protein